MSDPAADQDTRPAAALVEAMETSAKRIRAAETEIAALTQELDHLRGENLDLKLQVAARTADNELLYKQFRALKDDEIPTLTSRLLNSMKTVDAFAKMKNECHSMMRAAWISGEDLPLPKRLEAFLLFFSRLKSEREADGKLLAKQISLNEAAARTLTILERQKLAAEAERDVTNQALEEFRLQNALCHHAAQAMKDVFCKEVCKSATVHKPQCAKASAVLAEMPGADEIKAQEMKQAIYAAARSFVYSGSTGSMKEMLFHRLEQCVTEFVRWTEEKAKSPATPAAK